MRRRIDMNKLSNEQKRLVQEHLHVIDWVLYKSIAVNETMQGMGREDLYQTGCLALCEAALSFDGRVRFQTYAQTFVRNALIDICRKAKTQRKYCCHYLEDSVPGTDLRYGETKAMTADAPEPDCGVSEQIALQFAKAKQHHTGIALKGIEALELRYKGYTGKEIAALYHTSPKSVFSWISRAKQKLRQNGELEALLACCK